MLADDIVLNQYVNIDKVDKSLLKNFEPISGFKGTFDGNSYTIYGLYIESTGASTGLFTNVTNSTIKNLNISGAYVKGKNMVGGIVGYGISNVINCTVQGKIVGTERYTGGIYGQSNQGTVLIQKCINYAEVNGGSYGTGGIIGRGVRGTQILQCGNEGNITGGYSEIGGIMGSSYNWPSARQCYNKGNIKGTTNIGGITGYAQSATENCYNTGNVTGSSSYVAGITGKLASGSWQTTYYCYSTGKIIGTTNIGGVLGISNGNYNKLFWYNSSNSQDLTELSGSLNLPTGSVNNEDVEGKAEEITEEQLLNASFWRSNSYSESIWYLRDGYKPILKWEIE